MFGSLISRIDLFGVPVTLSFALQQKSRSVFGGVCSIIFFVLAIWSLFYSSQDLVKKQDPRMLQYETYTEDPRKVLISPNTFPFAFGIEKSPYKNYEQFIDESIYKMGVSYSQLVRHTKDGVSLDEWTEIPLETEICTSKHFGEYESKFNTYALSQLYCLKLSQTQLKEVALTGAYESDYYGYMNIGVKKCDNATSSIPCASTEIIEDALSFSYFSMFYVDFAVNGKNYSDPRIGFRSSYGALIGTNYTIVTEMQLGHVEITTDSGWLLEDQNKKEFIKINTVREYLNPQLAEDGYIFHLALEASRLETQYTRSYIKLQESLGAAQGLITTLMIGIVILVYPFSRLKFYESLVNEIFHINTINQEQEAHSMKNLDPKAFENKGKEISMVLDNQERDDNTGGHKKETVVLHYPQVNTKR